MNSKKPPQEKQKPSGLWRGIAFGALSTLLLVSGAAYMVLKDHPQTSILPQPAAILPLNAPPLTTAPADLETLKANYIELAETIVPLGEAFKLESQRGDMLMQAVQQVSQTTSVLADKIAQIEAQQTAAEPQKPAAAFHKSILMLTTAYANGDALTPTLTTALSLAKPAGASPATIAALEQLAKLPTTHTIQLTDIYTALDLLVPPTPMPAEDISQTKGWTARLGQLVTIRKIEEPLEPVDWISAKRSVKEALLKRDLPTATALAEPLDTALAAFIFDYQQQQQAWAFFINSYANEAQ